LIGISTYWGLRLFFKTFGFYWSKGYDSRKQAREKRRLEKLKWKYSTITMDNPLMQKIVTNRLITFKGGLGKGKTILLNVFIHYLWLRQLEFNHKNKGYNKVMRPDYLEELKKLEEAHKLPVYLSPGLDFKFTDEKGHEWSNEELLPYLMLYKRATKGAIFGADEISSLFPKTMYYENLANPNPKVAEMMELLKKLRHYLNGWFLCTEQDGEDIFIGFRKNGFAQVTALQTNVYLSKKGKVIRWFKDFTNKYLPALFSVNWIKAWKEQLFFEGKLRLIVKMLLPASLSMRWHYYTRKQAINNDIEEQYQRYETLLEYDGQQYWLRYTNADIFKYNTRAYEYEYDRKFDRAGNRKVIQEEAVANA